MKKEEYINLKIKSIIQAKNQLLKKNKIINIITILIFITFFIIIVLCNYYFIKIINKKIKVIAISYGDKNYQKQLYYNKKSALEVGQVDEYYSYGPEDIDEGFKEKNKDILSRRRGNGYWLWKPYFILKTLREKLNDGDYLFYTDAGILYMNSTNYIIDFLNKQASEMWMIRLGIKEKNYSKRDAFILLGVDMPIYSETYQFMAGIQIYKKSKYTEKFLEELLYYSQDKRIITDDNNTQGFDNYPSFIDHRHDQSILSLLIKKYGIANAGKTNLNLDEYFKNKPIFLPDIFCIYRRINFKNYEDLKKKCISLMEMESTYRKI